jgi:hypothetical protein
MSVVSSYHSTITEEVRYQSYYTKTNAFRDLMKAQNDKANKLEALIETGDLTEDNCADLGLKGIVLHRFIQDRRQAFHDIEPLQKPMDLTRLDQEAQRDLNKKLGILQVLQL